MTDSIGRSLAARHGAARLLDARALRARVHRRRQRRAPAGDDPPRAARLLRALHRDPDRALRRRVPALAGARAGDRAADRRPPRRLRRRRSRRAARRRAARASSTTAPSRSGEKIRDAELRKVPYMLVVGDTRGRGRRRLGAPAPRGRHGPLDVDEFRRRLVETIRECSALPAARTAILRPRMRAPHAPQPSRARAVLATPLDATLHDQLVPVPRRFDRRPPERDTTRINERIRVPEVRLIGDDGNQIGVIKTRRGAGVRPGARPRPRGGRPGGPPAGLPRARLLEVQVRAGAEGKAARKHQQQITVREIKLRPKIAEHDYDTKKGHVERFLRTRTRSRSRSCSAAAR